MPEKQCAAHGPHCQVADFRAWREGTRRVRNPWARFGKSSWLGFSSQVAWKGCVDATRGGYTKWKIHTP